MANKSKTQVPKPRKQDRIRDTRRKILLGALLLHRLKNSKNPKFSKNLKGWLKNELPGFLTREADRELFVDILAEGKNQW